MQTINITAKKRGFALFTAIIMALTLWTAVPLQASATDNVSYLGYNDGEWSEETQDGVTVITNQTDTLDSGWYVVNDDVTYANRLQLAENADVHLILADDCNYTVNSGIEVHQNQSLAIYSQSTADNMGTLVANGSFFCAGIGSGDTYEKTSGVITINGGIILANGGPGSAGIGGGYGGSANIITINGGIISAVGNDGAGIGGGVGDGGGSAGGSGGVITINGGMITATGTNKSAGIGGGGYNEPNLSGGTSGIITITGGTIVATSNGTAPGIGGGGNSDGTNNGIDSLNIENSIIFENGEGTIYGEVTLTDDFTIPGGGTLTIPDGGTLTIPDGATLIVTEDGTLTVEEGGTVTIADGGTLNNAGTIDGDGTIENNGTINNTGSIADIIDPESGGDVITAPAITTASLPGGIFNAAYSETLVASGGGTVTWTLDDGDLPVGLSLDANTGIIGGTPTAVGPSDFTVKATNLAGSDTKVLSITIGKAAGSFGNPGPVSATYSPTLKLSGITLPSGYAWNALDTAVNAGNGQTFAATYAAIGNYTSASGNITVNVAKADPTITAPPTAANINQGAALSTSELTNGVASVPGNFAWTDSSQTPAASDSFSVTFTPTDTANYNSATTMVSVTVIGSDTPEPPATGSWAYEDGVWKYLVDGVAKTGWVYDQSKWYYLNADGIMQTGWVYDHGKWYYLAGNGAMKTGWIKDDGSWYYLAGNGAMVAGKWLHDTDGSWYYLSGNGKMLTGKQSIGGKAYTFKANGVWIG
jgi:hypothetical protein